MSEKQVIIGINCAHDAAACLVIDGKIEVAVVEERLTRMKHQGGFPELAISRCNDILKKKGIQKIDFVIQNQMPQTDYSRNLQISFSGFHICNMMVNPSHHLLHACYAISASGFNDSAVLVIDGSGYSYGDYKRWGSDFLGPKPEFDDCCEASSSYHIKDNQIRIVDKLWGIWKENNNCRFRFPSLGHMYSLASQHIFGSWHDAGKVMGLAPFGDPNVFDIEIVKIDTNRLEINVDWILEIPPVQKKNNLIEDPVAPHLAAKVQLELEKAMLHLSQSLREKTQCENVCITGGVGLNTVCNGKIANEGVFKNFFITPAAQDSGVALGGAAYGIWRLTGEFPNWSNCQEFLGVDYSQESIIETLQKEPNITWKRVDGPKDIAWLAAKDIAEGKVVAWFEGRSEFGPRALGHRSILADARNKNTPNILNSRVKFRESFRPFAATVLEENCSDFFELPKRKGNPWMMFVYKVRKDAIEKIPGVVHIDKSCRIQTVGKNYNGKFRIVLEAFKQLTGVPLIVNTSLNVKGEPICEKLEDAIRTLLRSGIDVLYVNNFQVTKTIFCSTIAGDSMKVPVIHEDFLLKKVSRIQKGRISRNEWFIVDRYGWEGEINETENQVLELCDGKSTVSEIFQRMALKIKERDFLKIVELLYSKGVIFFKMTKQKMQ